MGKGTDLLLDIPAPSPAVLIQSMLDSGNPKDRLELIRIFTERSHSNPLNQAIADMLKPILDLPLPGDKESRRGKVAKAMGLNAGWKQKTPTTIPKAMAEIFLAFHKAQNLPLPTAADTERWIRKHYEGFIPEGDSLRKAIESLVSTEK